MSHTKDLLRSSVPAVLLLDPFLFPCRNWPCSITREERPLLSVRAQCNCLALAGMTFLTFSWVEMLWMELLTTSDLSGGKKTNIFFIHLRKVSSFSLQMVIKNVISTTTTFCRNWKVWPQRPRPQTFDLNASQCEVREHFTTFGDSSFLCIVLIWPPLEKLNCAVKHLSAFCCLFSVLWTLCKVGQWKNCCKDLTFVCFTSSSKNFCFDLQYSWELGKTNQ